jgi:putative hydrolase of the HAD superfamily
MDEHPTTLLLDIGGVLLTNGWDHDMRKAAAWKFGLDPEDMNERHHMAVDIYEKGKISLAEYLNRVVFYKERPFVRDAFTSFIYSLSRPQPDMIHLMRELKIRYNLRTVVISNEGRELTRHRMDKFQLKEFIDVFICSCFVHLRKPDEAIYQLALDVTQVDPKRAVYIDDRDLFVNEAMRLGIPSILHIDYETTRTTLAGMGLEISADERNVQFG